VPEILVLAAARPAHTLELPLIKSNYFDFEVLKTVRDKCINMRES